MGTNNIKTFEEAMEKFKDRERKMRDKIEIETYCFKYQSKKTAEHEQNKKR